jgi:S-DNA-T family DNA segregation ATPase FtsK/SpoIIIE
VAWTDEGAEVNFSIFHTLIVGQSGAGKGSVIWSIIFGLLPAARAGLVEFYAIDPKAAEAPMAKGLFKEIATDEDAWLELLRTLVEDLKARQNTRLGRTRETTISKETPLRILLIDELAAVTLLDTDAKRKKEVESLLRIILTQGRSELTMVIAAVQNPQKETLGQLRQSFGMRIALRTTDAGETDMVLGPGAVEKGALSHEIAVATKGNGNRTAGVAYMVEDDPENEGSAKPKKVRFPYTSDEDLREISDEFVRLKRDPTSIIAPDKRGRVVLPKPNQSVYDLADYLKGGMSPFDYLKTSTTQPLEPASTPAAPPKTLISWDAK